MTQREKIDIVKAPGPGLTLWFPSVVPWKKAPQVLSKLQPKRQWPSKAQLTASQMKLILEDWAAPYCIFYCLERKLMLFQPRLVAKPYIGKKSCFHVHMHITECNTLICLLQAQDFKSMFSMWCTHTVWEAALLSPKLGNNLKLLWVNTAPQHTRRCNACRCEGTAEAQVCWLERGSGGCPAPLPTHSRVTANTTAGHPCWALKDSGDGDPTTFPGTCSSTAPPQVKKLILIFKRGNTRPMHPDVQVEQGKYY